LAGRRSLATLLIANEAIKSMEPAVKITRREFSIGASIGVLAGAPALAQGPAPVPTPAELMAPGPLPEMSLGDANAPVTIVEYASMTCPHCAAFHDQTYPALKKKYIDTGKVRFIFREFPLDQLAAAAFMLARCAGADRYFPMIEILFHQQRDWAVQRPLGPLMAISKQAGMSEQAFNECLKDQKLLDSIEEIRQRASTKFGVQSTPTFFINGKIFRGNGTMTELEKEIDPLLKS
jgi:protein-disulfide isomerase